MTVSLRIVLMTVSVLFCLYIARKLKKSQIQLMDTVFWFGLSLVFIIMALFPNIVNRISELMGFMAPVNLVFLVIIFLLLMRCFLLSVRVSQLDDRLKNMAEEIAIRENLDKKKDN
jgi:hypothetical protein